jgi:hypothetical protein
MLLGCAGAAGDAGGGDLSVAVAGGGGCAAN